MSGYGSCPDSYAHALSSCRSPTPHGHHNYDTCPTTEAPSERGSNNPRRASGATRHRRHKRHRRAAGGGSQNFGRFESRGGSGFVSSVLTIVRDLQSQREVRRWLIAEVNLQKRRIHIAKKEPREWEDCQPAKCLFILGNLRGENIEKPIV